MKRLPLTVAMLLLIAGVWLRVSHREFRPAADDKSTPAEFFLTTPRRELDQAPTAGAKTREPVTSQGTAARGVPMTRRFTQALATGPPRIAFPLPDGRQAEGIITQRHTGSDGSAAGVTGELESPGSGTFHFRIQPEGAVTGPVVGAVVLDDSEIAFRLLRGTGDSSVLVALPVDQVICRRFAPPPEIASQEQAIPEDHPTNIPLPSYQNGVIPLQSRPNATGVIYLDFDGEPGPHEGWRDANDDDFDALPPQGLSPASIKNIWAGVSEDFAPFNLNVTTDLQVYLNAPETSRQRCIITPTTTAGPGAGGVAYLGSFSWSGDTPCWCFFYTNAKNAIEIISHEIGHTFGLSHDGQQFTNGNTAEYYWGHGSFSAGWAPIMGVGYNRSLTQWSKGEYTLANQSEDDIAIIAGHEDVGLVDDDHSETEVLEIFADGSIDTEGCISNDSDQDTFRFHSTGGSISITVHPVSFGANLDISAALHDANGSPILTADSPLSLNATLQTTIAAGEYTIRIDGTGKGNPSETGYTEYGSLGYYKISGTIVGATGPDRFTIAENSQPGFIVGNPMPRLAHGAAELTFSISNGNENSAFAIDPASGQITVANASAIDFEALSSEWDKPSEFVLTIAVSDPTNPSLNESLRVVVVVTDVNEPPYLSGDPHLIAVSHTRSGTLLGNLALTDPDRFDFATAQIIHGDPTGKFSLSSAGSLTLTGSLDASVQATYPLTIRTTDQGTPALTNEEIITVTVLSTASPLTPGLAYQTLYENIPGSAVVDLTTHSGFPSSPTGEVTLGDFSSTQRGNLYGSAVRAWLVAPVTGSYRFWIAGDDSAELSLGPEGIPGNMMPVCSVASSTKHHEWTKFSSQESGVIQLTAGQVCAIEARHKQDSDQSHLSVAWEIKDPADTLLLVPRQVIPGRFLSPRSVNYLPQVFSQEVALYRNSYPGSQVAICFANDANPADSLTWSITAGNELGAFEIDADTGEVTVASASALETIPDGHLVLTLTATDNGSEPLAGSGSLTVQLLDPSSTPLAGLIQEFWDEIPGTELEDLYESARFPDRPDRVSLLDSFDPQTTAVENFGTRIRALFIPPSSGSYAFSISSEDAGSLLLSSDESPENAFEIASTSSPQASLPVPLIAGQHYFIEARMKHSTGDSFLTATWSHAGSAAIHVIGDEVTAPYDSNTPPTFSVPEYDFEMAQFPGAGATVGMVNASDSPFETIRYAILSGDPLLAFGIHPITGVIRVVNPANLVAGSIYQLQVGAQDSGHGRNFAPRETQVSVSVSLPNEPPEFNSSPINLGAFTAGEAIALSLANFVTDPDDEVEFSLVAGPSWLSLATDGILTGVSAFADFGPHQMIVSASDPRGNTAQGIFNFVISAPASIPDTAFNMADANGASTIANQTLLAVADSTASDNVYVLLQEASSSGTSSLEYQWTFVTEANRSAKLEIEAYHSANAEDDDFQFSISTDGGATFIDAILVSNDSDDDVIRQFAFSTGASGSTIVRAMDTDRTPGNTGSDSLLIDFFKVTLVGNALPAISSAPVLVSHAAPLGMIVGSVAASDPDPNQTLTYTIPRGNAAGLFTISPSGSLAIAGAIPAVTGSHSLIVMATDNGTPPLANYTNMVIDVVHPVAASIVLQDLEPVYDRFPKPLSVTTDPPNLTTMVLYDGSPTPPTAAGNYAISVSIVDPLYVGTTTETLSIRKAGASIVLSDLSQPYDGSIRHPTVTTDPPGLEHALTYGPSVNAPLDVGGYIATATITNPNYSGSSTAAFAITNLLVVTPGQYFSVPQTTIPYQSLSNDGTLVIATHPLHVTGDVTNRGVLRLYGDAVIDVSGTFTNSGVIDVINWNGTLPSALVNTGTILDRAALRISSNGIVDGQFSLSTPGFPGHAYQLETSSLTDPWLPLGPPIPGAGDALNPPTIHFRPNADAPARFYRIAVTPAP